jgi:hypothetical protein
MEQSFALLALLFNDDEVHHQQPLTEVSHASDANPRLALASPRVTGLVLDS